VFRDAGGERAGGLVMEELRQRRARNAAALPVSCYLLR
jgi:hypothetical protein